MTQATTWNVPLSSPATPTEYALRDSASHESMLTSNKGSTAPNYAKAGTWWLDDSSGQILTLKMFNGTVWVNLGTFDATNSESAIKQTIDNITNLSGALGGSKNILLNGSFLVNQLDLTGTVTLTAGSYGHDCWKAGSDGCTYTFAVNDGAIVITIQSGSLFQPIENIKLAGSSQYVLSWKGTAKGRINVGAYGSSGVTANINGGSSASVQFTSGTLSQVQLEKGAVPTSFENRDISLELLACRRYFIRDFTYTVGFRDQFLPNGSIFLFTRFPAIMRANPTMSAENFSGFADGEGTQLQFPQGGWEFSRVTTHGFKFYGFMPTGQGTTINLPWNVGFRYTASARL